MTRGGTRALAFVFLASGNVLANGRFPSAGQIAFDPSDAAHLAVRTTFGVLESRDRGRTFDFVCESALRLGIEEDPMLAFTASGPLVVATFGGVLTSDDGCSFRFVPELEGQVVPDLAGSASTPDSLFAFRQRGLGDGFYESSLIRSDDAGASWTLFPPLPEEALPITVDVAAVEPSRVFLTARRGVRDEYDSVLMVSDDGGQSFRTRAIPGTSGQHLAYIAGVHPSDPDRLAVRIDDPDGTILALTRDAGATFQTLFTANGLLTGFAFSPDGAEMAFGGLDDGLWVGTGDEAPFERRSELGPSCLAWNGDGLWACSNAQITGFSLGRSTDGGAAFEPLLVFGELCGRSSCGAETDVGALCPNDWMDIALALGSECTSADGGTGDGGDAPVDVEPPRARGGCTVTGPASADSHLAGWAFCLVLLAAARRRRHARAGQP